LTIRSVEVAATASVYGFGDLQEVVLAGGERGVSQVFAEGHPNVTLKVVESGHALTDVLEQLWSETASFLRFQSL